MPLVYAPLPKGNYIRLLEVRQGFLSNELVCKFNVVCLDDCKDDYTAISYAWGNQSSPTTTVKFSDGQTLALSATLSSLFTSLQKKHHLFTVWIDAICINQQDKTEKSSQVALMGAVYSRAEEVLLWLGDETPETHEAFLFMESKQTWSWPWPEDWEPGTEVMGLDSMFSVFARAYFQRVWVVQEVTLNRNVVMACGDQRIDFDNFRHCVFAVWKFFEGWEDLEDDSDEVRGLYCATRMIFIRDEWQDLGAVRFEILLQAALHCKATDDRDMVFAFRGIGGRDRPVPEPDYEASVEDVYTETATALLCHGSSLDFLSLSGIACREIPSNLPSWVADLSQHSWSEPFVPCDRGSWDTGGPLPVPATLTPSNQLRLQVRVFDTVAVACPSFNSHSVTEQKTAVEHALALKTRLPYDTSDEEWLQTVAWSLIFGLDIEDQPAGAEYFEHFSSWLEWLQSSSSQADLVRIQGNKYHRTVGPRIDSWKALMTKRGSFCIGPPDVEVGDIVCVVPGCRFPLVLRASQGQTVDEAASLPGYILVSWCFVQGIMRGEAAESGWILDVLLQ